MKKKIIFAAVAMLCLSMLLSSCSLFNKNTEASFNSIVNTDWTAPHNEEKVLSTGNKMSLSATEVGWYNNRYVITKNYDEDSGIYYTYVYDHTSSHMSPIITLEDTIEEMQVTNSGSASINNYTLEKITENYVYLINNKYFSVLTVSYDHIIHSAFTSCYDTYVFGSEYFYAWDLPIPHYIDMYADMRSIDIPISYELNIYEENLSSPVYTIGNAIIAEWAWEDYYYEGYFDDRFEEIIEDLRAEQGYDYSLGCDLVVRGDAVYKKNNDGSFDHIRDFGASSIPSCFISETEQYYISSDSDNVYTFYDKSLNCVFTYSAPIYMYESSTLVNVLNNGNLFVQYIKALPTDAKKYDFLMYDDSVNKFSLTSLIVNPETGEETELNVDFIVYSNQITYTPNDELNYWADDVENIAFIYYIDDDKVINYSQAAMDWVSMSNEGKVLGSVKFDNSLTRVPKHLENTEYFYAYNTRNEVVIFDTNGTIVNTIYRNDLYDLIEYGYLKTDNAIYDIRGNKVYDLKENHADNVLWLDNGSFIVSHLKNGVAAYDVVIDGYVKHTYVIDDNTVENNRLMYVTQENLSMYSTTTLVGKDENNNNVYEYRYYNSNGELIGTFESYINTISITEDRVVAYTAVTDEKTGERMYEFFEFNFR